MTLKVGTEVRVRVARPTRWTEAMYKEVEYRLGVVREIKPENGENNILVDFYADVVTDSSRHSSFHFLAEDLIPQTHPHFTPFHTNGRRRTHRGNMLGLLQHVENHNLTMEWCTSGRNRGVLWDNDRMAGMFTVCAEYVLTHVEMDTQPEW